MLHYLFILLVSLLSCLNQRSNNCTAAVSCKYAAYSWNIIYDNARVKQKGCGKCHGSYICYSEKANKISIKLVRSDTLPLCQTTHQKKCFVSCKSCNIMLMFTKLMWNAVRNIFYFHNVTYFYVKHQRSQYQRSIDNKE